MTYAAFDQSREKSRPITLYEFGPVNGNQFYYTDADKDFQQGGSFYSNYVRAPISRSEINANGLLEKQALTITMPLDSSLGESFRAYPPEEVVNVVIKQLQLDDPTSWTIAPLVVWAGRVLSVAWNETELTLTCEPISTSMNRPGLRRNYQYACPHVLYGTRCGASQSAFSLGSFGAWTVDDIDGSLVTVPTDWFDNITPLGGRVFAPENFINGMFLWGGTPYRRTILNIIDGNKFLLGGTLPNLSIGNLFNLRLGCNHLMQNCRDVHVNINRFGGYPWIPLKNPFGNTNNFY